MSSSSSAAASAPWVERYRPKALKEVAHQSEVVATLQNAVSTGRLPHLLFYGPAGSGKTSVALALCRQLWHPREWKRRVLELNASDERGISVVRDKIKHFASLTVGKSSSKSSSAKSAASFFTKKKDEDAMDVDEPAAAENKNEENYPNPPFKVIILDEADTMTPDAQAALRRIIEAHSRITRFILICNYVTRIIEPLASRCAKFRFQPLPPASMKDRLLTIAHAEGCSDQELALMDDILEQADGDMRRAVTTLQSVHSLAIGTTTTTTAPASTGGGAAAAADSPAAVANLITKETIAEIAGIPPSTIVDSLWDALAVEPVAGTSSFDRMQKAVESVCADGFSAQILLTTLLPRIMKDDVLTELCKADLAIRLAEAEKNMAEGADEYLQLMTVGSLAVTCFANSRNAMKQ